MSCNKDPGLMEVICTLGALQGAGVLEPMVVWIEAISECLVS